MVLTKKHEDFSMAMLVYQRVSNALPGISNKFVYVVFFELVLYLQKIRKLLENKMSLKSKITNNFSCLFILSPKFRTNYIIVL